MLKLAVEESLEKKRTMDPEEYKQSYTKESRVEAYEQLQRQKEESEAKSKENSMFSDFREFDESFKKKPIPSVYTPQGDIRQCNEGRYEFQFSESDDGTCILLEMKLPRFMDTSLVNVDLHPLYVRLDIKGKITQLKFEDEIHVDQSKVQRSQTTGALLLTMPKANLSEIQLKKDKLKRKAEDKKVEAKIQALEKVQQEAKQVPLEPMEIREAQARKEEKRVDFIPDFDVDEVPPLE